MTQWSFWIPIALAALCPLTKQPVTAALAVIAVLIACSRWTTVYDVRLGSGRLVTVGAALATVLSMWVLSSLLLFLSHFGLNRWAPAVALALVLLPTVFTECPAGPDFWRPGRGADWLAATRARYRSLKGATAVVVGVLIVLYLAGGVGVTLSMKVATDRPSLTAAFALFWVGLLTMVGSLAWIGREGALKTEGGRFSLLVGLAIALYLPQVAREPRHPLLYDEIGHWGETEQILHTGRLFHPDGAVPIGPKFPGLETATALASRLSGIDAYHSGMAVILLAHIAALAGMVLLARQVGVSPNAQMVAATVYAIGPSFLRIDGWFSYESLAVPIGIWFLASALQMRSLPTMRSSWWLICIPAGLAMMVTHHLTTYAFVAFVLISLPFSVTRRKGAAHWKPIALIGLGGAALAVLYVVALNIPIVHYLSPYPKSALDGVLQKLKLQKAPTLQVATIAGQSAQSRALFGGSLLPAYERIAAYAAPAIVLVVVGFVGLVRRRRVSSLRAFWLLVACVYLASVPLTATSGASPGAHRSWAETYIAVGIVVAIGYQLASTRTVRRKHLVNAVTLPLMAVLLVGNYAAGCSAYLQFPGPFEINTDGRSVSNDMITAADWFAAHEGRDRIVMSDIRVDGVFGAYAGTQTADPGPEGPYAWDVFYKTKRLSRRIHRELLETDVQFIIVDRRLATVVPQQLPYFSPYESPPPSLPLPAASITKFDRTPWLDAVYAGTNITIYKVLAKAAQ